MPPVRTTTDDRDTAGYSPSIHEATGSRKVKRSIDWREIRIGGEDQDSVPVYDDCDVIRRKIRKLQRTQGFRITYWLRNIGGIKYNSWSRFMKAAGPNAGVENGIYYAAYIYFEKVRIVEGMKKTARREENELAYPQGFAIKNHRQSRDSTHN